MQRYKNVINENGVLQMKNNESVVLFIILIIVALTSTLIITNSEKDGTGKAYVVDSVSIDMISGKEYLIYGKHVYLEYVDIDTIVLNIEGISVKIPNGEKVTYKNLGIFSYGGEETDNTKKSYKTIVDFYK